MRFTVVTLFPEMFESVLAAGVVGRACAAGQIAVDFVNPRDFTSDRHRTVDDTPAGGGPGMVMKVEPLIAAIESIAGAPHRVLMTPAGAPLVQQRVRALAALEHVVLVCGRYEGIDERVSELAIDEELSVGDFVLSGGEIAALAVIDAVARYVPGVLGAASSTEEESFSAPLLEYPQYTRPRTFRERVIPEVLHSGNHAAIARWRRAQSLQRTATRRPDLLARHAFTEDDARLWRELGAGVLATRTYVALVHHPIYDRERRVITTAVTNLDIHDLARSAATYGLAGAFIVTPITAQRDKVEEILAVWQGRPSGEHRAGALALEQAMPSLEAAGDAVAAAHGGVRPRLIATTADVRRIPSGRAVTASALAAAADERPLLLVFGTGWGLTDEVLSECDQVLTPLSGGSSFNHLSVRSAVAIMLDRLFGR